MTEKRGGEMWRCGGRCGGEVWREGWGERWGEGRREEWWRTFERRREGKLQTTDVVTILTHLGSHPGKCSN